MRNLGNKTKRKKQRNETTNRIHESLVHIRVFIYHIISCIIYEVYEYNSIVYKTNCRCVREYICTNGTQLMKYVCELQSNYRSRARETPSHLEFRDVDGHASQPSGCKWRGGANDSGSGCVACEALCCALAVELFATVDHRLWKCIHRLHNALPLTAAWPTTIRSPVRNTGDDSDRFPRLRRDFRMVDWLYPFREWTFLATTRIWVKELSIVFMWSMADDEVASNFSSFFREALSRA